MSSVRRRAPWALALLAACGAGRHDTADHGAPAPPAPTPSQDQVARVNPTPPAPPPTDPLVPRLVEHAYGDPWNYAARTSVVGAIWKDAGGADRLVAIAADEAAPLDARFLACEVLFDREPAAVRRAGRDRVARLYARALTDNLTGRANSWGLLWEHDDKGPVGIRFIMLGKDAIPALRPLLDDARPAMRYEGSEEATVGNAYGFRIKDFAAYYLSQLTGIPLPYHAAAADRDRAIAELAARLPQ